MSEKIIKVPVRGLHCRSCELLLEDKLKDIKNIAAARVDYRRGEAVISCCETGEPDMDSIKKAVAEAGYEVRAPEKIPFFAKEKRQYVDLAVGLLILTAIYFILKNFGSVDFSFDISRHGLGLAILIGLAAGFSTCMALVGGLSLGLSAKFAESHPTATAEEKFRPHIFFMIGRILSYILLGGLLGLLGTAFKMSAAANGIITTLVGVIMLLMGLQLINIFPRLNAFKLSLPKNISRLFGIGRKKKEYSHKNSMILGALTFFLPCGFTQAMQLYAVGTGSFVLGAATMGLFALGTAPGLLSIGGITALVSGKFKEKFFKIAGLAVIFFGLFNLSNGLALAGFDLKAIGHGIGKENIINDPNVKLENGVQIVRMIESNRGYSPNAFSIKKGVPVKWIIDAQAPYSCASSLFVSKLGIQKNLVAGENIIEFTATEAGRLPFSCSMGMYTGAFNVYDGSGGDDNISLPVDSVQEAASLKINSASCGEACGGNCGGGCGNKSGGCGGGGVKTKQNVPGAETKIESGVQIIKSVYTDTDYLQPNSFKVKAGQVVKLIIDVKDDGYGCGSRIMIPGLYDMPIALKAGKTISMEFTPKNPGSYDITCSMEMIRFGTVIVE